MSSEQKLLIFGTGNVATFCNTPKYILVQYVIRRLFLVTLSDTEIIASVFWGTVGWVEGIFVLFSLVIYRSPQVTWWRAYDGIDHTTHCNGRQSSKWIYCSHGHASQLSAIYNLDAQAFYEGKSKLHEDDRCNLYWWWTSKWPWLLLLPHLTRNVWGICHKSLVLSSCLRWMSWLCNFNWCIAHYGFRLRKAYFVHFHSDKNTNLLRKSEVNPGCFV